MPNSPTVHDQAIPARTTIPKVVNCRKQKTAPITIAANANILIAKLGKLLHSLQIQTLRQHQ